MSRSVIRRDEMFGARLNLGGAPIELDDYATTGLRVAAIAGSGCGKSNAGILIAEQLVEQGWVAVLVDPESELESLYGTAVKSPAALEAALRRRDQPFLVVAAKNASEFVPYGQAVLSAAEKYRKPIFLMVDEGQMFSSPRSRKNALGDSADIVNDVATRGRKRCLDMFVTCQRYAGSVHRSIFATKNITLIGTQSDPTQWSAMAPQFRGSKLGYHDLQALAPGEFFCFTRRGVEKVCMPMAQALEKVAHKARVVRPALPTTFSQWDRAMRDIPTERLQTLTGPVVSLLGAVAGLTPQQLIAGGRALEDELECRA